MKAALIQNKVAIPLLRDKDGGILYYVPGFNGHSAKMSFPELYEIVKDTPLESRLWFFHRHEELEEIELPESILRKKVLDVILKVKELRTTEEVVLTMNDIAEKFNLPVETIKIKK